MLDTPNRAHALILERLDTLRPTLHLDHRGDRRNTGTGLRIALVGGENLDAFTRAQISADRSRSRDGE